ncbi:MAG: diguanylate cyclase [Armatimonadota bacterium]|nr:diguanylate cyclase [Armatimonadota bacterium]
MKLSFQKKPVGLLPAPPSQDECTARALFDDATTGVALVDARGHIVRSNPALQEILGYRVEELNHKTLSELVHPGDLFDDRERFSTLAEGKCPKYEVEQRYFRQDGRLMWGRLTVVALPAECDGCAIAMLEDITRRVQAEDELHMTRDAIHNLYEVVVNEHLDLQGKMRALLVLGCRRFQIETGLVGRIRNNELDVLQVVSPDERIRRGQIYEIGSLGELSAHPRRAGALAQIGLPEDWHNHPIYSVSEVETFFGAPIIVSGQIYGIISFSSFTPRAEPFETGEKELLQLMAQWLGSEVERRQARSELEKKQAELVEANSKLEAQAALDGLTGVRNRRSFDERLRIEFERHSQYEMPLSFLLLDVDRFKQYNDTFGHPAGDEVLKRVARILQGSVRGGDFVARYGGEEFAIIMPNTDYPNASTLAERLRATIEAACWPERPVTASFGVATLTSEIDSPSALLATADQALYHSKAGGRNRVTHALDLIPRLKTIAA